jgi:glycosyltransferase involved in cell wall biosynthesis
MVTLANNYARLGIETLLVLAKPQMKYREELVPQVHLVNLHTIYMWRTVLPLARFLRRYRPDALLSTLSEANIVCLLARRLAQVPMRVVVREANTPSEALLRHPTLKKRFAGRLLKHIYRWADAVVAVSEGVRADLVEGMGLDERRVVRIFNPVPLRHIRQQALLPVDHSWFVPGHPPVVLGVGRLAPQKDFCTLIKAFAQVRQRKEAHLVILGEGPERPKLEALAQSLGIASEVWLPGFDPNPFRYMYRADVFVLSSRYEGFPNVLIQAMACGCPVISTDCPSGPRDILQNGKYGMLVPVGSVETMAEAILRVLEGERVVPPVDWIEQFDEERVAQQYLHLLLPHEANLDAQPLYGTLEPRAE